MKVSPPFWLAVVASCGWAVQLSRLESAGEEQMRTCCAVSEVRVLEQMMQILHWSKSWSSSPGAMAKGKVKNE